MYINPDTDGAVRDANLNAQYGNAKQNLFQFGAASIGLFMIAYFVKTDWIRWTAIAGGVYTGFMAIGKYESMKQIDTTRTANMLSAKVLPFAPIWPSGTMAPVPTSALDPRIVS